MSSCCLEEIMNKCNKTKQKCEKEEHWVQWMLKRQNIFLNVIAWRDKGWNLAIRWSSIAEAWDSDLTKLIKLLCSWMEHFCHIWQYLGKDGYEETALVAVPNHFQACFVAWNHFQAQGLRIFWEQMEELGREREAQETSYLCCRCYEMGYKWKVTC